MYASPKYTGMYRYAIHKSRIIFDRLCLSITRLVVEETGTTHLVFSMPTYIFTYIRGDVIRTYEIKFVLFLSGQYTIDFMII